MRGSDAGEDRGEEEQAVPWTEEFAVEQTEEDDESGSIPNRSTKFVSLTSRFLKAQKSDDLEWFKGLDFGE
jgi:hypothetical protein